MFESHRSALSFIDRVRKNLHVVLCMSPVGPGMRNRCRKFPALSSCTVIDWFHSWPQEALISVALRFLELKPRFPFVELAVEALRCVFGFAANARAVAALAAQLLAEKSGEASPF